MRCSTVVKSLFGSKDPINNSHTSVDLLVFRLDDKLPTNSRPAGQKWYQFYFVNGGSIRPTAATITLGDASFDYKTLQSEEGDKGYILLLSPSFFPENIFRQAQDLSFMNVSGSKSFSLNDEQTKHLTGLFDRIMDEFSSSYRFKNELIAVLMMQLVHFMVKNFGPAAEFAVI
jgi:hypothetical protein